MVLLAVQNAVLHVNKKMPLSKLIGAFLSFLRLVEILCGILVFAVNDILEMQMV